jgi:hypothetical protein
MIAIPTKLWLIHLHKDVIWSKYDAGGGGGDDNNDDGTNNNNNNNNNNNKYKEMGVKSVETSH